MVEQMEVLHQPCYPKYILKDGACRRSKPSCDLGSLVGCGWREVLKQVSGSCRAALHPDIHVPHCLFSPRAGISYPGEPLKAVGFWKESGGGKQKRKRLIFLLKSEKCALEFGIICNLDVLQSSIKDPRWQRSSRSWVGFHPRVSICSSLLKGRAQL